MAKTKTKQQTIEELQARLQEMEDTLEAIRSGAVDAIVTSGPEGERVYTLEGADHAYHTMVESMNEGAVTVLTDGTILYSNRQFGRMTGASPSGIVGRPFHDFVQPSDHPTWNGLICQAGSDGLKAEIRLGNQSAAEIPVQISATPIDLGGRKALSLVVTDLTESRRYEELVAAERLSRYILEQSLEGVAVCINGRILFASRRLHEIYGSNPLMQPFDKLFPLRMSERETFSVEIPQSGQVVKGAEVSYQNPDGESYSLILNAGPLYGDKHRILGSLISLTDITERKRAQDELRESEERFRLIASNTPDHIFMQDRDLRYSFVINPQPGLTEQDMIGKTDHDLVSKAAADELTAIKKQVLESDHPVSLELPILSPGGGQKFFNGSCVPTRGADGRVDGLIGYFRDVTQRKLAEMALLRNEAQFRLLSGTAGRLLATDDPQGLVKELCRDVMEYLDCQAFFNFMVDERAGRLRLNACAGIPEEEVRKLEWLDYGVTVCGCVARDRARIIAEDIFHTPDVRTELVRSYGIQAYCCHPLKAQERLIGTLSFGTKTRARFTPDEVELMRAVADQVSVAMQRIQAQQEIRESSQRLQLALDAGGMGMWAWDLQTSRTIWSPKQYELMGLPAGDGVVDAEEYFRPVHPDDAPDLRKSLWDVIAHGSLFMREFRITRADGQRRWLASVGRVTRAECGQPLSIIGINYDITERKGAEDALRRWKDELEEKVHERTEELMLLLEELEKGRDDLRKLASELVMAEERERKRIAVTLHDEVAQTLAAAKMRLDLLKKVTIGQESSEGVDEVLDLLMQSIRETRSLMTEISNPILYEMGLPAAVQNLAEQTSAGYGLSVSHDVTGEFGNLEQELSVLIYQAVRELLQNVSKHSQARNVSVRVIAEDTGIRTIVADDGRGFEVGDVGLPKPQGGFGLFSIRERVKSFRGSMKIESAPGKGTVVTVVLPSQLKKTEQIREEAKPSPKDRRRRKT